MHDMGLSATAVLVILGLLVNTGNCDEETFNGDFLFYGIKHQGSFSHRTSAYYISPPELNNGNSSLLSNSLFESPLNGEIWALATDYHSKRIYYTDHATNFIGIYNLETHEHTRAFEGLSWGIDGLSVDWVSGNVYWIDSNLNWIMVSDKTFTNYRNLMAIESDIPAKIAVDPKHKYIYWSERRINHCRIRRSKLHGYEPKRGLILPDVQSVIGMTIDFGSDRLYWTERLRTQDGTSRIRYIRLPGTFSRSTPIQEVYSEPHTYYFGITSFRNYLYVTDEQRKELLVVDKRSNQLARRHKFNINEMPRGIAVYSANAHPLLPEDEAHDCRQNHACQQLCLGIDSFESLCECRMGFTLQPDGRSCKTVMLSDNFAIAVDARHAKLYQMNMMSEYALSPQEIQVDGLVKPNSVAYDPLTKTVFWSDEKARTISSAGLGGTNQKVLLSNSSVSSLAVDSNSGNLYWVDSAKDAIFVSKLNGSFAHTLHVEKMHIVFAMTIDAIKGYLYWADWGQVSTSGGTSGVVKSSRLDGSNVTVVARPGQAPHVLTLDPNRNILFWAQIHDYSIQWINLDTKAMGKYRLPSALPWPILSLPILTGITYWRDTLYISDQIRKHMLKVKVSDVITPTNRSDHTSEVQKYGPAMFYQPAGVYAFDKAVAMKGTNVCSGSTCPHLCVPAYEGERVFAKCICQDHYRYDINTNSCQQVASLNDTTPPSFGDTCPGSYIVITDECSDEAEVNFKEPTATDDSNLPVTLKRMIAIPQMPMRLKEGSYSFFFIAVDKSHNKAYCRFSVDVVVRRCFHISLLDDRLPLDAHTGEPSCGEKVGSLVNVTCDGSPDVVAYQYRCQENLEWGAVGEETCYPAPATDSPQIETTKVTPRTTISRKVKLPPIYTVPTKESKGTEAFSIKSGHGGASEKTSSNTGLIVVVVITLLILIVIGAAIIIVYRRREKRFIPGTNWNRADDRVQLTGASTESGIYLGDREMDERNGQGPKLI